MNTHYEIQKLRKQGATLKYVTLSIAAVGIIGAVFMIGGREGYGYAIHKIRDAVQASQYPTAYLTYPGLKAAAIVRNGVCYPYPAHVPPFHYYHYVNPQWEPCTQLPGIKTAAPSPALAAITNATK